MQLQTKFNFALYSPFNLPKLLFARLKASRYRLEKYQVDHLYLADQMLSLRNKRVLEVGGALPKEFVLDHFKCKRWTGVDNRKFYTQTLGWQLESDQINEVGNCSTTPVDGWSWFDGIVKDIPDSFHGQFDLVFSNAVLEHVNGLSESLVKMKAALVPGGLMYHTVGPIWSGPAGYHVFPSYFSDFGKSAGARVVSQLRPWMHLAMTKDEMYSKLQNEIEEDLSIEVVESIYHSSRINRLLFSDYLNLFRDAGLRPLWIKRWTKKQRDYFYLDKIKNLQGVREDYLFNTFTIILSIE